MQTAPKNFVREGIYDKNRAGAKLAAKLEKRGLDVLYIGPST